MNKINRPKRYRAQQGQVIIEAIASIIIFTILIALIMTVTTYLYFQQALVTAAREGTRQASLNSDIGATTTENVGITTVKNYVIDQIKHLTGQTYSSNVSTITVVPPSKSASQTNGQRTVSVTITWKMKNPIPIGAFLTALGSNGTGLDSIPVGSSATMRYEE